VATTVPVAMEETALEMEMVLTTTIRLEGAGVVTPIET
jgi:hypothetical protein